MSKKVSGTAGLVAIIVLALSFYPAYAHESITVGDYEIEVGWLDEPPIAGQKNAIVLNVSNIGSGETQPVEDVSSLVVTISYGGQSKELTLQPLGEDTPGQFMSPILPTVAGEYTIILGGQLGETSVDAHVEPEEVDPADTLQFPVTDSSGQNPNPDLIDWLVYLSLTISLIALGLGVKGLRKPS